MKTFLMIALLSTSLYSQIPIEENQNLPIKIRVIKPLVGPELIPFNIQFTKNCSLSYYGSQPHKNRWLNKRLKVNGASNFISSNNLDAGGFSIDIRYGYFNWNSPIESIICKRVDGIVDLDYIMEQTKDYLKFYF